ncbi:MAG: 4-(cytidine 5'-diphospho)-2-C-methyl-D-erythritol kinase [Oligosphaeraceae bacterium]|nr:4-(cytidine 5'-diphospho)-2-C-methyl-D-erythritol kinase [Oligosphaeraceae bacterium]
MLTPAKINLYLRVLGSRPDSFHELRTVFLPLPGLCDRVEVVKTERPGLQLSCNDASLPCDADNICWRAAELFLAHFGLEASHSITLYKHIPVAAGLGGGSSDAAAVLLSLLQLHGLQERKEELHALATQLGSDVPFFLDPKPALGSGRGEILEGLPMAGKLNLLLINPGFPIPVSWAYQNMKRPKNATVPDEKQLCQAMAEGDCKKIAAYCWNDLEFAIFDKFPILQIIREFLLSRAALCVHVSGSGPSLFAILAPETKEELYAAALKQYGDFARIFLL